MKVAMAQVNPVVGDVQGNLRILEDVMSRCSGDAPDLVVFPELFLTGYPPVDILERDWFIATVQKAIERVAEISKGYPGRGIIVGAPVPGDGGGGRGLRNSALLIADGVLLFRQDKSLLPTYDVFDEARYFDPAPKVDVVEFAGEKLGISICEDAWSGPGGTTERCYSFDPVDEQAGAGATIFINISSSPFHAGKEEERFGIINGHARRHDRPFVYVNLVGGNDELIFDGRSMLVDRRGEPVEVLPAFQEAVVTVDASTAGTPGGYSPQEPIASVHDALVLGVRDYLGKCGFSKAVVGLSGGIDSAVVCALAAEALGNDNVMGVTMPGPYSSGGSVEDSRRLADNLGIEFREVPIADAFKAYRDSLAEHFGESEPDIAEENLQARVRGNILMAVSNRYGHLVLSTGNKSELAVGYCTLYGDMSGGLSVISDVPKTMVYDLARYMNRGGEVIPEATISKPPSAELRPDQKDQDTLPPYDVLDDILHRYLEKGESIDDIVSSGHDAERVHWVVRAVHRNEYKRRQAAPGLKVTSKAFGKGRRMAVAAKYDI